MFKSTLYEETHPSSVDFRCKDSKKFSFMQIKVAFCYYFVIFNTKKRTFRAPMSFLISFARISVPSTTIQFFFDAKLLHFF